MEQLISPKFQIQLIKSLQEKIWDEFKSYKTVLYYIQKWHESENGNYFERWENFTIHLDVSGNIDLLPTLNSMNGSTLLKIAIDLGIDTPDFIPSVPTFKNEIKDKYQNVYETFIKALKNIETDPSISIGLINSTFESLIKEILKDETFNSQLKGTETLYKLVQIILNEFKLNSIDFPVEIKTICTSLISIGQSIEKLRSEKTIFHGKTKDDLLIEDSIYVYLVVNAFTTVGIFLTSFYKKKYIKSIGESESIEDDLPF